MSHDILREVVEQDVDLSGTSYSTAAKIVDLTIPTGKVVTGAGALLTHVDDGNGMQVITSLSDWAQYAAMAVGWNGPHPTDSTKWRFVLNNYEGRSWGAPVRVHVWLIAIDPH